MKYEIGDLVLSKAGRDKASFLIVVGVLDDKMVFLADGKSRKIEKPKLKKIKHISKINVKSTLICDKIKYNEKIPNALIRKEIERIKEEL
ncbi:RNA-binding protein [Anaerofustis butyriciformans]|uniref:RNA-binding protein n=1 Tax=Anaerofustis butyriciformans TaxID=3108533 RepID=UPI003F8AF1DB